MTVPTRHPNGRFLSKTERMLLAWNRLDFAWAVRRTNVSLDGPVHEARHDLEELTSPHTHRYIDQYEEMQHKLMQTDNIATTPEWTRARRAFDHRAEYYFSRTTPL
jgi:hypothetical protein